MNLPRRTIAVLLTLAIAGAILTTVRAQNTGEWPMGGQNLFNTRNQAAETIINAGNVGGLVPKWVFTTDGSVSATPAVVGGAVYLPDWSGNFYKIDGSTGKKIWARKISEYNGKTDSSSRTYPAVDGNVVYIGTMSGADLIAVNTQTGDPIWVTPLDAHPTAIITQSPVVYNGVVYVGVSSQEEALAFSPSYRCCTFRGSFVAVNAATGAILWRTYTVPDNQGLPGGYSGGSVWSSTPVVDAARHAVYVTTGNDYTVPRSDKECTTTGRGPSCKSSENHFDSVMSLDMNTGATKWVKGGKDFDNWTFACLLKPLNPNCPPPAGTDADFGSGANLFSVTVQGQTRQLLGAGEKNGVYWAFEPDTGQIAWATQVGPGGLLGGIEWGSAVDGQRIYVAIANTFKTSWTLSNGQTVTGGFWSALDAATGRILWQTADPAAAIDQGAVTVANGVVYVSSGDTPGTLYALDASSGRALWSFVSGGAAISGPAVVNGVVYWTSGFTRFGLNANNKLYAFALP